LTLLRAKDTVVKNTKLLQKYLHKLTLVIIYPPTGFKWSILANISPEISSILGDFIEKYRDKSLPLRWWEEKKLKWRKGYVPKIERAMSKWRS